MIILLLEVLIFVIYVQSKEYTYCSSTPVLDDSFSLNTTQNRCDSGCEVIDISCYYISGVTTCFPPKRVSNNFLPAEDYTWVNVTDEDNITKEVLLPGTPDMSENSDEIFYNGQWLTSTQWVKKTIKYCKINYVKPSLPNNYLSIADRSRTIKQSRSHKRNTFDSQEEEQAIVACNASTSSNEIYNNTNYTIGTVLKMNDQCVAFSFVPRSAFYINYVTLMYSNTGPAVAPLTAYVMSHIVETTFNIMCFAQTTNDYVGLNQMVVFNFHNCYIPFTTAYNVTITIGFTCDNDRVDCSQNLSTIVRSYAANVDIDQDYAYGVGSFKTLSSSDCFGSNPQTSVGMTGGIRGFGINAGICTQAPTSAPTTKAPTKPPTLSPTQYPTFPPVDLIVDAGVDVYHTWEQPILKLITNTEKQLDVWLSKPGINFMYDCNETCTIEVPDNFYITGDDFTLWVYDNNSLVYTNTFSVLSYISCPIPVSPVSPLWSQSWHCFGPLGQFILVASLIGMTVIFLCLIAGLSMALYVVGYCVINRSSSTVINNINFATDNIKNAAQDTVEKVAPTRGMWSGYNALVIFILIPCVACSPVMIPACNSSMSNLNMTIQPCQYSFSVGSQDIICNGGICEVNFNKQITFSLVGQTVCLNFLTESGTVFSTMQLTYLMHVRTVRLNYNYATYSWSPFSTSNKGCASTSICPLSGCPAPPLVLNPSPANTEFNDYAVAAFPTVLNSTYINSQPSIPNLDCSASCGCAGCGCFFCSSGCMWAYYKKEPTGDLFNVFTPSTQYSYPVLEGFFYRPDSDCYDSIISVNFKSSTISVITPGSSFARVNIEVSNSATSSGPSSPYLMNVVLISSVVTNDINFGENKVICNMVTNECFYGYASPPNAPAVGVPGDIQYAVNYTSPQVWNPLSVIKTQLQSSTSFSFPPVGARFMTSSSNKYPSFPYDFGSVTYSMSNYNMIGIDAAPGPLTVGLNTLAPYQVTYTDSTICPEILLVIPPNGCSSCDLGSTVTISIKSTCSSGIVFLSLSGPGELGTQFVFADTSYHNEIITFFPSDETGSFTLSASYKGKNSSVQFTGYFPKMSLLDNGTWITQNNESSVTTTNNIGAWWDNQSLAFKIGVSFSVGIGLATIVGLLVGSAFLVYFVRTK